jgi:nucleotide-binding universal stress UspA family protein
MEAEMTIVCGTDFSVYATHAANVAAALAVRRNSTLTLVHALEPARLDFLPGTHMDHLREKLRRKLVTEGNRLRTDGAASRR